MCSSIAMHCDIPTVCDIPTCCYPGKPASIYNRVVSWTNQGCCFILNFFWNCDTKETPGLKYKQEERKAKLRQCKAFRCTIYMDSKPIKQGFTTSSDLMVLIRLAFNYNSLCKITHQWPHFYLHFHIQTFGFSPFLIPHPSLPSFYIRGFSGHLRRWTNNIVQMKFPVRLIDVIKR